MSIPISWFIPPIFPPCYSNLCSLCLRLCFCFVSRFICTVFIDSTYMHHLFLIDRNFLQSRYGKISLVLSFILLPMIRLNAWSLEDRPSWGFGLMKFQLGPHFYCFSTKHFPAPSSWKRLWLVQFTGLCPIINMIWSAPVMSTLQLWICGFRERTWSCRTKPPSLYMKQR